MDIKEKFIKQLIDELNNINEFRLVQLQEKYQFLIDVCFVVSVIYQQIKKCKEFMEDISKNDYCINHDTLGRVAIVLVNCDYYYHIDFMEDKRDWDYCECSSEDIDYNFKYDCCGIDCRWDTLAFKITKVINIGYSKWEGKQKDYWEYKENFEKNRNEEVEKYEKEQRKKYLEEQIYNLQKELEIL